MQLQGGPRSHRPLQGSNSYSEFWSSFLKNSSLPPLYKHQAQQNVDLPWDIYIVLSHFIMTVSLSPFLRTPLLLAFPLSFLPLIFVFQELPLLGQRDSDEGDSPFQSGSGVHGSVLWGLRLSSWDHQEHGDWKNPQVARLRLGRGGMHCGSMSVCEHLCLYLSVHLCVMPWVCAYSWGGVCVSLHVCN